MAEDTAANQEFYKVTNTTVKEKPSDGPDTRTPGEMNGNVVSWQDSKGMPIGVRPGEMKIIPGPITEQLTRLQGKGRVKIEKTGDLGSSLSVFETSDKHTKGKAELASQDREMPKGAAGAPGSKNEGATPRMDKDQVRRGIHEQQKVNASRMGDQSDIEKKDRDQLKDDHTTTDEKNKAKTSGQKDQAKQDAQAAK